MDPSQPTSTGFGLIAVVILVLANAFFVATEFALVSARKTRLDEMARGGNRKATLARRVIQSLARYISATQLGITLTSLGLGWVGEPAIAHLIRGAFAALPSTLSVVATHTVAAIIAFIIITMLHITFGELESLDARAALSFLRSAAPGERIGIIGVSMGGAASLVGSAPLEADALVLESVYPTLRDAVSDRLHVWLGPLGFLGGAVTPALVQLVAPHIGVDPDSLRPIDVIGNVTEPLLMIAGTDDQYTRLSETRALYAHATSPKQLWEVEGAGHEDLHRFAPAEYERRVGDFLATYLRGSAVGIAGAGAGAALDSASACAFSEAVSRRECR